MMPRISLAVAAGLLLLLAAAGASALADDPHALACEFAELRGGAGPEGTVWYLEGTIYAVADGAYETLDGLTGFYLSRVDPVPGSDDRRLLTRGVVHRADPATGELRDDRPPLLDEVSFLIGVRDGVALAGLDFRSGGEDRSGQVPPVEILAVTTERGRRFFTRPFVDATAGERPYWAAESYEFLLPADAGGDLDRATLVWQRDTELPGVGRVHFLATARRYADLDAAASASARAAAAVARARRDHADFLQLPPP